MANELNIQLNPANQTGLDLVARIKSPTGATIGDDITLTEFEDSAFYVGDLSSLDSGRYTVAFYEDTTMVGVGELFWNGTSEISLATVDTVRKALLNNMKVDTNQLIIYEDDGITPVYTFNLFDSEGEPTSTNITEIENA